ncbi:MAG: HAD-IA family hydrolase [Anaerolineaceae bacterium]
MDNPIRAIFLDVGNTLRFLVKDPEHQEKARWEIARLAGVDADPEVFCAEIDARYKEYRKWAFEEMREAPEEELWTRWLLPDLPAERIRAAAHDLTYQYRQASGRRIVPPDARSTILELNRRGYVMGIISNLITTREIPDWLAEEGLTTYFKSVMLSSVFGYRKPHPAIYEEATRRAGVEAACCAYVGDNPDRDVEGTRAAGFGMVILMLNEEARQKPLSDATRPDLIISRLSDLLNHFPGVNGS